LFFFRTKRDFEKRQKFEELLRMGLIERDWRMYLNFASRRLNFNVLFIQKRMYSLSFIKKSYMLNEVSIHK
jgi:NAD-dependent SIR2 family protein deacetylase